MTENEAKQVHQGDVVMFEGHRCVVRSINVRGIAAPHFRLIDEATGHYDGLTSYQLCGLPPEAKPRA